MTLIGDRGDYGLRGVDDGMVLSRCAQNGWEVGGFVEIDVAVEEEITRVSEKVEEASSLRAWARHGSSSEIQVVCTCNVGPSSWLGGKIGGERGCIISNTGDSMTMIRQICFYILICQAHKYGWRSSSGPHPSWLAMSRKRSFLASLMKFQVLMACSKNSLDLNVKDISPSSPLQSTALVKGSKRSIMTICKPSGAYSVMLARSSWPSSVYGQLFVF